MQENREEVLMTAYAAGDEAALEPLFDGLAPRVLALFALCVPEPQLAEDLLEQTFMRLRRLRHTYRPGTPVRPFVYGIAANLCADRFNTRRSEAAPVRALGDVFAALSGDERLLIYLHRHEGLQIAQIAAILGVSEAVARAQVFRLYQQLRERLQPLLNGGEPS